MPRTRTVEPRPRPAPATAPSSTIAPRLADAGLLGLFLGLVFLLGLFPLKDTDFWWHLRTGDMIRQTWHVPNTDPFTFGAEGHRWIDLHWLYQVLISWGYQHGGVPLLNQAKSAITCAALLILILARRRDGPVWVMLLAWLPALAILSGRMYVRPETLSLLYLSIDLAILSNWERRPRLAYGLPVVQLFWVNTQGLFVFGPMVIGMALLDAAARPGAFDKGRRPWWRTVLTATAATGAVCILNPYGLLGAVYPIELLGTMSNPIFRKTIGELKPVGDFIAESGWYNAHVILYVIVMVLGALSFLVPLLWSVVKRLESPAEGATKKPKKKAKSKAAIDGEPAWRLRPFRLLLCLVFSALSWQATRNSHQFAAVMGAVTAWNLAEWVAALKARPVWRPRFVTAGVLVLAIVGVAGGRFYELMGEGRTIGLGEEPLWYPKDAVAFAGRPGMPERFVLFHNGHAALYEYMHGPDRKAFADARLEVAGADLYTRYIDLQSRIGRGEPGWSEALEALGSPGVLTDNVQVGSSDLAARLLAHPRWRLVWFDPIAAVFVPTSAATKAPTVDFASRHFHPDPKHDPQGVAALLASARALRGVANSLYAQGHAERSGPIVLLGQGHARRVLATQPDSAEAWKRLGQLLALREPTAVAEPRFRQPFDAVLDLNAARAIFALRKATLLDDDFTAITQLAIEFQRRGLIETAVPLFDRLLTLWPENPSQRAILSGLSADLQNLRSTLGSKPPGDWKNLGDLDSRLNELLEHGRVESAARLLGGAYRPEGRTWDVTNRLATLRLHLGQPDLARAAWEAATSPPRPGVVAARVAATHLVEGDFEDARRSYQEAIRLDPTLFEAHYGLAILERDAGRADEALDAARRAVEHAPNDSARAAAEKIVAEVEP